MAATAPSLCISLAHRGGGGGREGARNETAAAIIRNIAQQQQQQQYGATTTTTATIQFSYMTPTRRLQQSPPYCCCRCRRRCRFNWSISAISFKQLFVKQPMIWQRHSSDISAARSKAIQYLSALSPLTYPTLCTHTHKLMKRKKQNQPSCEKCVYNN